ncbi:hypothetical protein THIOM_001013 [Candidatus Thiomargarita nelsonii]|uniref:Secreted protein n=1 Tax=Candidatus Thiomargarita nelsonii TaxID=1003181 RepID=A0A176S5M5_9GAMM|nr:hypothetical protein THIOM_001013 [Candidatus Thiomargarita nelsonii]
MTVSKSHGFSSRNYILISGELVLLLCTLISKQTPKVFWAFRITCLSQWLYFLRFRTSQLQSLGHWRVLLVITS